MRLEDYNWKHYHHREVKKERQFLRLRMNEIIQGRPEKYNSTSRGRANGRSRFI